MLVEYVNTCSLYLMKHDLMLPEPTLMAHPFLKHESHERALTSGEKLAMLVVIEPMLLPVSQFYVYGQGLKHSLFRW